MPVSAEVVIVGAGITGLSIAYHLARLGCREVIVCEREAIAAGATGLCPGGFRQQWGTEVNCRLARHSHAFWRRANAELKPEHPLVFREGGYLFLAHSPEVLARYRRDVALQNQLGIPSRVIGPEEVRELIPLLNPEGVLGASWCPEDGYATDPHGICMAFAAAARRLGVRLVFSEVIGIERRNGAIAGVITAEGRVATRTVVNCAGIDAPRLAAMVGVDLPIVAEPKRLAFTRPVGERLLEPIVVSLERGFGAKQMHDGTFMLSALEPSAGPDGEAETAFAEKTAELALALLPSLAELQIHRQVLGYYDTTPDCQAVLGGVDGLPGYYLACGFSGHGFMLAPAVGLVMAQGILGLEPSIPIASLHHRRFAQGALVPEPQII